MAVLHECANLMFLDLSRNEVLSISGLEGLARLERLDISYNSISSLAPLRNCSRLFHL